MPDTKPFAGAFDSPQLVSETPGHTNRINAEPYVFVQPKLDGWCCMANTRTRKIYTRSGREITTLPHINAALPETGPEWLHGELWREGATCDTVQSMVKRGDLSLEFHVFDCVSEGGFGHRASTILGTVTFTGNIVKRVNTYSIDTKDITWNYYKFLDAGYEGIIIRLDGHGYYHGRSRNVFKIKPGTEGV
jgi:ATP-dependent DNA ligase